MTFRHALKRARSEPPEPENWGKRYLCALRVFCQFLLDEEYNVPPSILKLSLLDEPRHLPRPLLDNQARRLDDCLQSAKIDARTAPKKELALRDLACFYLLWHSGLVKFCRFPQAHKSVRSINERTGEHQVLLAAIS